jgi:SAM-dependent methyltransferase
MAVENVYDRDRAAGAFDTAIKYDPKALEQIAGFIRTFFSGSGRNRVRILDIGVGSGAFIIPIIEEFQQNGGLDFGLDCFDISEQMIKELMDRLSVSSVTEDKVHCFIRDANEGLGGVYRPRIFDIVVITFVLHYIDRWESLIDDVARCLAPGGMLVQAEIIGDLRNMDGKFDIDSQPVFQGFWKEYFKARSKLAEWSPEISVSDLSKVYDYLKQKGCYEIVYDKSFLWDSSAKWADFCDWIDAGLVSSLGSGLRASSRRMLSERMLTWLGDERVDPDDIVRLNWGFRIRCHRMLGLCEN